MTLRRTLLAVSALVTQLATVAAAQTPVQPVIIGTFHWQLQPYCSTVSLTVFQEGDQYRLQGTEGCAGATPRPVFGTAVLAAGGLVYLTLSTPRLPDSPEGTSIYAGLELANLTGVWNDNGGRSGSLVPVPGPVGGTNPRGELGNVFRHTVSTANRPAANNVTCFSHPLTDGRSSAQVLITVNRGPASDLRPIVASTLSVYYDDNGTGLPAPLDNDVWCISRDDSQPMPLEASFNVRVLVR